MRSCVFNPEYQCFKGVVIGSHDIINTSICRCLILVITDTVLKPSVINFSKIISQVSTILPNIRIVSKYQ